MFTVPRSLSLFRHLDGQLWLHQLPASEIAQLYTGIAHIREVSLESGEMWCCDYPEACRLDMDFKSTGGAWNLTLDYGHDEILYSIIDPDDDRIKFIRRCSLSEQLGDKFKEEIVVPVENINDFKCTLLIDRGCVEVYCQNGAACASILMPVKAHCGKLKIYHTGTIGNLIGTLCLQPLRKAAWKL